ncbi:Mob1/phocein [Entophlyctis helioformis]|nr:Mob1/phocein [Entophlyctis helioformis]
MAEAAEQTLGATSAGLKAAGASQQPTQPTQPAQQQRILQRNRRGIRAEETFQDWPDQPDDAAGAPRSVQDRIQSLVRRNPADVDGILSLPAGVDESIWQYEHLKQVCLELNDLFVRLEDECRPATCPDMKAGEWMYLCAAHTTPAPCRALDYIGHTIDHASALLNQAKLFPSRVSVPETSLKQLHNIARRLYRIFAHAWYHHREIFGEFEVSAWSARFMM